MHKINKRRIFDIIQIGNRSDLPSRAFDVVLAVNIVVNILVLFAQTFDSLECLEPVLGVLEVLTRYWPFS